MAPNPTRHLGDFLRQHQADILAAWEDCVRQLPPAERLPTPILRDHLPVIIDRLASVAMRMEAGGQPEFSDLAGAHALARLNAGFDLGSVVSEFALLRSAIFEVLARHVSQVELAEVKRLDEAIDETVSGSVCRFAEARERTQAALIAREREARALLDRTAVFREQFISMLAHDLRNPLQAIRASADLMLRQDGVHPGQVKGLLRINQSAERMARMIADVLDFARGRVGGGIRIERRHCNLHDVSPVPWTSSTWPIRPASCRWRSRAMDGANGIRIGSRRRSPTSSATPSSTARRTRP